jgi:hypothetical protein
LWINAGYGGVVHGMDVQPEIMFKKRPEKMSDQKEFCQEIFKFGRTSCFGFYAKNWLQYYEILDRVSQAKESRINMKVLVKSNKIIVILIL